MNVLAFDTATPATAVAFVRADGTAVEERHEPRPGERPGHATQLLELIEHVLAEGGAGWDAIDRIVVGAGPGTFTGLRIGVATARGLAQGRGIDLVAVSTLEALAAAAGDAAGNATTILAVLDARRGEAF